MRKGDLRHDTLSKVFTRVAFQLIRLDARNNPDDYAIPCKGVNALAERLFVAGFKAAGAWVVAYRLELDAGFTMLQARDRMSRRAAQGHTWRAVAFASYKRQRRP